MLDHKRSISHIFSAQEPTSLAIYTMHKSTILAVLALAIGALSAAIPNIDSRTALADPPSRQPDTVDSPNLAWPPKSKRSANADPPSRQPDTVDSPNLAWPPKNVRAADAASAQPDDVDCWKLKRCAPVYSKDKRAADPPSRQPDSTGSPDLGWPPKNRRTDYPGDEKRTDYPGNERRTDYPGTENSPGADKRQTNYPGNESED
ncbi:hypothetical protein MMC10_004455 [Thelotrema lepadinum]|nr:hypothetical protein [Thelotrema lepadinum]